MSAYQPRLVGREVRFYIVAECGRVSTAYIPRKRLTGGARKLANAIYNHALGVFPEPKIDTTGIDLDQPF